MTERFRNVYELQYRALTPLLLAGLANHLEIVVHSYLESSLRLAAERIQFFNAGLN